MEEGDEKMDSVTQNGIWSVIETAIALAALVVSIIALIKSSKADKLQAKVNELELEIKAYELSKIKKEQNCIVSVNTVKYGKGKHRLRVYNAGENAAYNVSAKIADNPGVILMEREMQPYECLDGRQNYEMVLISCDQSKPKFTVQYEWSDIYGKIYSDSKLCTLK